MFASTAHCASSLEMYRSSLPGKSCKALTGKTDANDNYPCSGLLYRSSIWSSGSEQNISKLQKMQNFAARMVTGVSKEKRSSHIPDAERARVAVCR